MQHPGFGGQSPHPLRSSNHYENYSSGFLHEPLPDEAVKHKALLTQNAVLQQSNPERYSRFVVEEKPNGQFSKLPTRTALDNQKLYMEKYSYDIELPSVYVIDAMIHNVFPDYCFQLAKIVVPSNEKYLVNTNYIDGSISSSKFDKILTKYKNGLVLRMLKRDKDQVIQLREVILEGIFKAHMKFSTCGQYFALIVPQNPVNKVPEQVRICKMQNNSIFEFMSQLSHKKYQVHYPQLVGSFASSAIQRKQTITVSALNEQRPQKTAKHCDIDFINYVVFDQNCRFLIAYGKQRIFILNIEENNSRQVKINEAIYEELFDVNFASVSNTKYQCYVACKKKIINQIVVFDMVEYLEKLHDPNNKLSAWEIDQGLTSRMELNFGQRPTKYLHLIIASNFKQVVFTDQAENFILEKKNGFTIQKKLTQLENKLVQYIEEAPEPEQGFYFMEHKEYDKSIKIIHSNREKKIVKIQRNIEPDMLKIYDFHVERQETTEDGYTKRVFRVCCMRDDQFIFDYIEQDERLIPHDQEKLARLAAIPKDVFKYKNLHRQAFPYSELQAFSLSWPYVACTGFSNYLILINAFDRKFVQRIQLADESQRITICDTYISDTYDLFILLLNQDEYRLYMIDLDSANAKEVDEGNEVTTYAIGEPIFQYKVDQVENRQFMRLYVRGSSRKEEFDRNEKLYAYFLHEGKIFAWTQLTKYSRYDQIQFVSETSSSQLLEVKHGHFIFLKDEFNEEGKLANQKIIRLQTNFSMFQLITYIQRGSDSRDKIQEISIDHQTNFILLLIQVKQQTGESDETFTKIKLFDIDKNKTIASINLRYDTLIGRLKSGLFRINDGHIYYNNNFIKMRYDLILSPKSYKYKESQFFDFYEKIFAFKEGTTIRSGTPLDSIRYHRFIYVTRDLKHTDPIKILMLPYLHERRIYLNRIKDNTQYFYTTIDTPLAQEIAHNEEVRKRLMKKLSHQTFEHELELNQPTKQDKFTEDDSSLSIVCMNLTARKYYVYGPNGVLQNRINYGSIHKLHGDPIATSSNGQYFIFKRTPSQVEDLLKVLTEDQAIEDLMTIRIYKLSIFKLELMKEINLLSNLRTFLVKEDKSLLEKIFWLFDQTFQSFVEDVDFKIVVNDRMHVCVRFNLKNSNEYDHKGQRLDRHTISQQEQEDYQVYYFEHFQFGQKNVSAQELESGKQQSTLITKSHGGYDFIINRQYIFLWDNYNINYGLLSEGIEKETLYTKADFTIDAEDAYSYIKEVRTGSNPEIFVFVVQQSTGTNSIYTWFSKTNAEAEAYDVEGMWEILWDKLGNLFIVNGDKVILNNQRLSVKTYDFQRLDDQKQETQRTLSNARGHRFDFKNHNWLIFQQYLSLSFSYITFVILNKIDNEEPSIKNNMFDPEPYNYIFNKGTSFLDGDFVYTNHQRLQKVLQNFAIMDPDLLELLVYNQTMEKRIEDKDGKVTYKQVGFNTALYMAVTERNNRSADLILDYMSRINFNSSRNIMSVFSQLVNYKKFIKYLNFLPVQTPLMTQKQVLRTNGTYDDRIVKLSEASCIQIDEAFYRGIMKEPPRGSSTIKNYPVNVVAMRIAWILEQKEGKDFLWSVYNNENLQYYKIPTVYIIVEFLYYKYKTILLTKLLPAFLLQATFIQIMVYLFEGYVAKVLASKTDPDQDGVVWILGTDESRPYKISVLFFLVLNFLGYSIIFYFQLLLLKNMGRAYFKSFYSLIDMIYILLNVAITITVAYVLLGDKNPTPFESFRNDIRALRNIEAICIFLLYTKNGYFLSLIDATAPLIDNITEVIIDIRYFILVLLLQMWAFASSFYIIGQNQLDFDNIPEAQLNKKQGFGYKNLASSCWYVYYNFILNGRKFSYFDMGEKSQRTILFMFYIIAANYIIMILLNMLIALMQKTFATRRLVADEVKIKDHLKFVLDNWHLMDFALKNKSSIKYVIAALAIDESGQNERGFNFAKEELRAIDDQSQENFNKLQARISQNTIIVQSLQKDNEDESKARMQKQENMRAQEESNIRRKEK